MVNCITTTTLIIFEVRAAGVRETAPTTSTIKGEGSKKYSIRLDNPAPAKLQANKVK